MKTLIFAVSFVLAGFLSYGWFNTGSPNAMVAKHLLSPSVTDTIPKSKDSLNKKYGKDSLSKRDTSMPRRDSSSRQ